MNRQSLGPLIVGIISVGSGLWVALQLRIGRCLDGGGRWDVVRRVCERPEGAPPEAASAALREYAIGGLVMLVFGYMLMRMWAAIDHKNRLRLQREAAAAAAATGTGAPPAGAAGDAPRA